MERSTYEKEAHQIYLNALRAMGPERRLKRAFELSDFGRELFLQGLRKLHPELSETDLYALFLQRICKCHNRNW